MMDHEPYRIPGMPIFDASMDDDIDAQYMRFLFHMEMLDEVGQAFPDPVRAKRAHSAHVDLFREKVQASLSNHIDKLSELLGDRFQEKHDDLVALSRNSPEDYRRLILSQGRVDFFKSGQFISRFERMPTVELIDSCFEDVGFHAANLSTFEVGDDGRPQYGINKLQIATRRLMEATSRGISIDEVVDRFVQQVLFHELLHYGSRLGLHETPQGLLVFTSGLTAFASAKGEMPYGRELGGGWAEEAMVDWLNLQINPDAGTVYPNNVSLLHLLERLAPGLVESTFDVSFRGVHADLYTMVYPAIHLINGLEILRGRPSLEFFDIDISKAQGIARLVRHDPLAMAEHAVVPDEYWHDIAERCRRDPILGNVFDEVAQSRDGFIDAAQWKELDRLDRKSSLSASQREEYVLVCQNYVSALDRVMSQSPGDPYIDLIDFDGRSDPDAGGVEFSRGPIR